MKDTSTVKERNIRDSDACLWRPRWAMINEFSTNVASVSFSQFLASYSVLSHSSIPYLC